MKRLLMPVLAAMVISLGAWVLSLWIGPKGEPIGTRWVPPAAVKPDIGQGKPLPQLQVDLGRFVATLERPLFVPTRRPPPPPPPPASTPAVEPLPPMRLLAVYGNADAGGLLAVIDGRIKRVKLGETIYGWTVNALQRSGVELSRGDEKVLVEIKRGAGPDPGVDGASAGAAGPPATQAFDAMRARELQERRRATTLTNELRARAGLPPLPLP